MKKKITATTTTKRGAQQRNSHLLRLWIRLSMAV